MPAVLPDHTRAMDVFPCERPPSHRCSLGFDASSAPLARDRAQLLSSVDPAAAAMLTRIVNGG